MSEGIDKTLLNTENNPQKNEVPIFLRDGFEKWLSLAKEWDTNAAYTTNYYDPKVDDKLKDKPPLSKQVLKKIIEGRSNVCHYWPYAMSLEIDYLMDDFETLIEWANRVNYPIPQPDISEITIINNRLARFNGGPTKRQKNLQVKQNPSLENIDVYSPVLEPFQESIEDLNANLNQPDKLAKLINEAEEAGASTIFLDYCQRLLVINYGMTNYRKECLLWAQTNKISLPPEVELRGILILNIYEELRVNKREIMPLYIEQKFKKEGLNNDVLLELGIENLALQEIAGHQIFTAEKSPKISLTKDVGVINHPQEFYILLMTLIREAIVNETIIAEELESKAQDIVIEARIDNQTEKNILKFSYKKSKEDVMDFSYRFNVHEKWNYKKETLDDKVEITIFEK